MLYSRSLTFRVPRSPAQTEEPTPPKEASTSSQSSATAKSSQLPRKLREASKGLKIRGLEGALQQLKEIADGTTEDEHAFDTYCQSLAVQLNQMPLIHASECQVQLQQVMTTHRLR